MPKRKYKFDVCPECKVRKSDSTKKTLYRCQYCERWFCADHFDPRLAVMRDLARPFKDVKLRSIVEEEWRREDGHPDYDYTLKRLKELEVEKDIDRRTITAMLDRSKMYKKRTSENLREEQEGVERVQSHISHAKVPESKKPKVHRRNLRKTLKNAKIVGVFVISLVIVGILILSWTNFFAQLIMPSTVDTTKVDTEIFQLINEERTNQGLPVLLGDEALGTIALEWSTHLAETGNLTHGDFEVRIASIGYSQYQCGEIIGMYGGWSPTLGREFIDMWLNSQGHREVMLTPLSGYMGVGVSRGGNGFFAVVDFRFI